MENGVEELNKDSPVEGAVVVVVLNRGVPKDCRGVATPKGRTLDAVVLANGKPENGYVDTGEVPKLVEAKNTL